jgi:AcrR family transcriptional regulator
MARQVRSEATRRKIVDAAIDVFGEVGYAAAGLSAIIERTGMTKGALYHHFDSMESLVSAIVDEGSQLVLNTLRATSGSSAPALENIVHGTFVIADLFDSNKMARTAEQLIFARGNLSESGSPAYTEWSTQMATEAARAIAEGDMKGDLDPNQVSESIVGAMLGTRLLTEITSGGELIARMSRMWELLLPAIVTEQSLPYFREFVAREVLRHAEHS